MMIAMVRLLGKREPMAFDGGLDYRRRGCLYQYLYAEGKVAPHYPVPAIRRELDPYCLLHDLFN